MAAAATVRVGRGGAGNILREQDIKDVDARIAHVRWIPMDR